jgi:hypothetical protein
VQSVQPGQPQRASTPPAAQLPHSGARPSLQALNQSFDPGSSITLQQFIIVFGCIQLVLSQVRLAGPPWKT